MANLEKILTDQAEAFGQVWTPPTALKEMIDAGRIRLAGTDNALLVEIDGETYSLPDAWRLSKFPD